jgi:hypothetical protein
MIEILKVEIRLVNGDWQWLGLLTNEQLKRLTEYADNLNSEGEE